MIENDSNIRVVDPQGRKEGEKLLPGVKWFKDVYEAAKNVDLILILTEWNEFRALDLLKLSQNMRCAYMADFRNIYSNKEAKSNGFEKYISNGRL